MCSQLTLGDASQGGSGTLQISGTSTLKGLTTGGAEIVGYIQSATNPGSVQGIISQSGGLNSFGTLYLGYSSIVFNPIGTYTLSGGSMYNAGRGGEYVGYNGSGYVNQTGGTNNLNFNDYGNSGDTNSTLTLGWSNVGSGNYTRPEPTPT